MKPQLRLAGLLLCLAVTFGLSAQTHINNSFADAVNQAFATLEKDRVPYGLLKDAALEFTELSAYNGVLTDTNYVTPVALKQLYHTLFTARVHPTADPDFIAPQDYTQTWQMYREPGRIVLSGLCYTYAKFAPDALATNKLQVLGNSFLDRYISGVWQNPYETATTFAIAPPVRTYEGLSIMVLFPESLWLTNEADPIQSLEMDAGDGLGYRTLTLDGELGINYDAPGLKEWSYRLTLESGEVLYSHSKIQVETGFLTEAYSPNPAKLKVAKHHLEGFEHQHITATIPYEGVFGGATLLIDDAGDDGLIQRPLIVVEGFDPGIYIAPEDEYGITDIEDFLIFVTGSTNIDLINLLQNDAQVYDIIYVNWDNGTDFIQRNAFVLEEVITWVNQRKAAAGSVESNVVWGQSMGGLVARYALADMETNGLLHDTSLYISHDAPHQGANVPLGYQYMSRHALNQYVKAPLLHFGGEVIVPLVTDGVTPMDFLLLQNTPAARQMLMNYVDEDYNLDNSVHEAWQQDLQTIGYPAIRNIAISNGNHLSLIHI